VSNWGNGKRKQILIPKNMKIRNKRDKREKYKEIDSDCSSGLDPDIG
jgi:hypothetical protein